MSDLTVTSKGQVTLKQEILRHLGVTPGERVVVQMLPHGRIEIKAKRPIGNIANFIGCLKDKNRHHIHLTIDEISEATEAGWAGDS